MMTTFGVEEEYIFLEPTTLSPVALVDEVFTRLGIEPKEAENIQHEFLACQIERSTGVCRTLDEAHDELVAFRRRVAAVAGEFGALVASTGFAPGALRSPVVSDTDRYRSIRTTSRTLVDEHYVNGLHVHVGIPDKAAGLAAMNRIRVWMPTLVALAANSPVHLDADTGFASWRTLHFQRWTTHGCPPTFDTPEEYEERLDRLVGIGGSIDRAVMSFNIRLSVQHPTLEIRAADVQLEARESVMLAAIIRALVRTAMDDAELGLPPIRTDPELLDAALWHAARDGVADQLVDPRTGRLRSSREVVGEMLDSIETALLAEGDSEFVHTGLTRLFREGNGATRQRLAHDAGGRDGLRRLLVESYGAGAEGGIGGHPSVAGARTVSGARAGGDAGVGGVAGVSGADGATDAVDAARAGRTAPEVGQIT